MKLTAEQTKELKELRESHKKDLSGIDFLRDLTNSFDYRNEYLNADKTPLQLIKEYELIRIGATNLDGIKYED